MIFDQIGKMLENFSDDPSLLIPALQDIQDELSYIPLGSLDIISDKFNIPVTQIYGVISFFAQFRTEPVGKNIIKTCMGTACFVNNAEGLLDRLKEDLGVNEGGTTPDRLFTLEKVACLGCCSLAPVIMINDKVYGKLDGTKIKKILQEYREGKNE